MIYNNLNELVGNTPTVRLNATNTSSAEILLKLENFNPFSSVKDRIGKAMIEQAEKDGILKEGAAIIEATSGNTGIALAFVGAVKGYRVILTMPETMSVERRRLLKALGAELVLTPGHEGMLGSIQKAEEIHLGTPGSFMPRQFENPANPQVHVRTTAEEIWRDCEGKLDIFVAAVGTGGTITGTGRRLRELNPAIEIIAAEPADSAVLSGEEPGPHKIQGIGAGFVPKILDTGVYSEVLKIGSEEAAESARTLARQEGILCGISAGANVCAALKMARRPENAGKRILTIICDTGERYLSLLGLFDS